MNIIGIKVYSYDELSEKSKAKATKDYITDTLDMADMDTLDKESPLYKAIKKADDMQTPWFTGEYVWDSCKENILSNLREMLFTVDGKFFNEEYYNQ